MLILLQSLNVCVCVYMHASIGAYVCLIVHGSFDGVQYIIVFVLPEMSESEWWQTTEWKRPKSQEFMK